MIICKFITEISIRLVVDPADYRDSKVDYLMLSVKAVVEVTETGQSWVDEDRFILEKPEIEITVKFIMSNHVHLQYHVYTRNTDYYSINPINIFRLMTRFMQEPLQKYPLVLLILLTFH